MIINNIELSGFMRFKDNNSVNFGDGINIFYGQNGAGKTSILDAICIALYGKTYRTSGTSDNGFLGLNDLVNKNSNKAHISFDFSIKNKKYRIEKEINKSGKVKTALFENDEQIAEGKNVSKLIVNNVVGMDFVSFKNSSFIAQDEAKLLLSSTGNERKETLKKLLKLNIYDILIDISNEIKRLKEEELAKLDGEIIVIKVALEESNELTQKIEEIKEEILKLKNTEKTPINELKKEIDELNDKLKLLRNKETKLSSTIASLRKENQILLNEIRELKDSFSKVEQTTVCPVCFNKITNPEYLRNHYKTEIANKENKININNNEIKTLEGKKLKFNNEIDEIESKISSKREEENKLYNENIKIVSNLEGELKSKISQLKEINENKKLLKEKEEHYKNLQNTLNYIEILKGVYKEVPNEIIRKITPYIESETNEVVSFISNGWINGIKIDRSTFKINPIVNGIEEELQFLSGGERLRVGLALRLAISKVIASIAMIGEGLHYSGIKTLFIDEGDFGELDEDGLNEITSLFYKLKEKFNKIVLITHINTLKDNIADYAFSVKKLGFYESIIEKDEES